MDVAVSRDLNGSSEIKGLNDVLEDELILDIGPKSIKNINNIITFLNSTEISLYFENPNFAKGSIEIAKKLLKRIQILFILW